MTRCCSRLLTSVLMICALVACSDQASQELPTLAAPEALATSIVLTRNAPPTGFDTVSFVPIDERLTRLPGWRYEMAFEFEGIFSRTSRTLNVNTMAEVQYSQVDSARRIVAELDLTDLREGAEVRRYEAVRLGPDAFLVEDNRCLASDDETVLAAADLGAGVLLGGVERATTAAQQAIINGETVWRYTIQPDQLSLPSIELGDGGQIRSLTGELWVAPEHDVVVRYYLTLNVENVSLFGSALPVDGVARLRYDLYDIGTVPNLTVPFGC